jgi:hypothetical protein
LWKGASKLKVAYVVKHDTWQDCTILLPAYPKNHHQPVSHKNFGSPEMVVNTNKTNLKST